MVNLNFSKIHRKIAPILFIPLLLSSITGIAFRLGRTYFGVSDELGESILSIHEGKFLGKPLVPFYILLLGLGLVAMIATAILMFKQRRQNYFKNLSSGRINLRSVHGLFAVIFFAPLFVSAVTGVMFRISRAWFGLSEEQAEIFMEIHQGNYLGSSLRVIYVLLIGLGLLGILITGIQMTGIFPRRTSGV